MKRTRNLIIIITGIVLIFTLGTILLIRDNSILITNNDFKSIIHSSSLDSVVIDDNYIYLRTDSNHYKIARDVVDLNDLNHVKVSFNQYHFFYNAVAIVGIIFILIFAIVGLFRLRLYKSKKDLLNSVNNSSAVEKNISLESNFSKIATIKFENVRFDDIAGIKEVKDDLLEIIDYIKNPKKYQEMGINLPKGVLLVGPPGVGKTMIAKAIAGEANVPFFYQSGSSFAQIYVGMGAKRVRELFYAAKTNAPSIIFIDEIDAVGKSRGSNRNDEREATLNQLLTEMDGFEDNRGVIVVGATNRIEVLDPALLRAGRFDRRIFIDLPDLEERKKIIALYLRNKNHCVNIDEIARQSVGFSGAALASLVNEASLNALRKDSKVINNDDFYLSHSKIAIGTRKQLSFTEQEKYILSLYQAAKAISAYWCDIDFDKVTLLGDDIKQSDKNLLSRSDLINKIKVALSGNVVLEMNTGEIYTNCKDDIQFAKEIAIEMSKDYAMMQGIISNPNDVENELQKIKDELKIFFNSLKAVLKEVQERLIKSEKITKEELKDILKDGMFCE